MGVAELVKGFDSVGVFSQITGEASSNYNGFESAWYYNIGLKICFTIYSSAILTNIAECKRLI
jgi:hypothetical protein